MAFSPTVFSLLRAFKPRAFLKTRSPTDLPVGEPGTLGARSFVQLAFGSTAFAPRSLRGLRRPRVRRRFVPDFRRFDARVSGSGSGGLR